MSEAFNTIKQGLTEAIEFAKGNQTKAVIHDYSPVDVKAIREKIVVEKEPKAVLRALSKA